MTVDRSQFAQRFQQLPSWDCPTCGRGHLQLEPETLKNLETGPSKAEHGHDAWDPDWVESRFVAILKCNFGKCGELVAIGGMAHLDRIIQEDHEGRWHEEWVDEYEPQFLLPAPMPIRLMPTVSDDVRGSLREAATLLWQSPEAAANQVRQAVEHLLDDLKVKKNAVKPGKSSRLTLHARIEEYIKKNAAHKENGEILLAVKWLGNSGSHAGGLVREDVLIAFDMIELVLTNVYGNATKALMKQVKAINKAKGPAKKKK